MKAMVFAAGKGRRLSPFSHLVPKPLLPFRGKTILEWVLTRLREIGVGEVMINLHHLGDRIAEYLGDGSGHGMRLSYSREDELLGTGGGLKKVEPFFTSGTFLALNSDIFFELPLAESLRLHRERGADVTLLLTAEADPARYGGVSLDPSGRVRGIGRETNPSGSIYVFTGIQILEPPVFSYLSPAPSSTIPAYLRMAAERRNVFGEVVPGTWQDLGTLSDYLRFSRIP